MINGANIRLDRLKLGPNLEKQIIEVSFPVYIKELDCWFDFSFDIGKLTNDIVEKLKEPADGTSKAITEVEVSITQTTKSKS